MKVGENGESNDRVIRVLWVGKFEHIHSSSRETQKPHLDTLPRWLLIADNIVALDFISQARSSYEGGPPFETENCDIWVSLFKPEDAVEKALVVPALPDHPPSF